MLDPTSPEWTSANPTPPQAFFALLWEQLCGGSTLDSWQLRAMNLPSLLQEVIEVCAVARSFAPLQRALIDVLDEAVSVSHRDPVLKDHFRTATAILEDPKLRDPSPSALAHAENTALHLLDTLRPYPDLVRKDLERLLADQEVREKKRLAFVANSLGTELHIRGFSRFFLHSFADRMISTPFDGALQELLALLDRPVATFRCIVPVAWPAFLDDVQLEQGAVLAVLPDVGTSQEATSFRDAVHPSDRFFVTEVEARDQFAAAHKATLHVGRVLNLVTFYAPNRKLELPRRQMLVQSGATAFLVGLDLSHETYIRDSRRSADKLLKTSPRVMELLAAPLQYHALGVQATAPESRLTNFWVALESLLVEHEGSIIERVTKYIPPSLSLSYCNRLLRTNAIQLAAFIQAATRHGLPEAADLRGVLAVPARGRISIEPGPFAELLVDDARAGQLFGLCAKNPLLIFRLNQMRKQIKSSSDLKQSLEGHREGVGWQLGRIYRARNSLVHRGTLPPRAEHLIQHLHTYLSMTLHYLVREIGDSSTLTVTAAFARRRALYDVYVSKVTDKCLTFKNLTFEATCWQASNDAPIWPPPAAGAPPGRTG